jgi:hypothetical protein
VGDASDHCYSSVSKVLPGRHPSATVASFTLKGVPQSGSFNGHALFCRSFHGAIPCCALNGRYVFAGPMGIPIVCATLCQYPTTFAQFTIFSTTSYSHSSSSLRTHRVNVAITHKKSWRATTTVMVPCFCQTQRIVHTSKVHVFQAHIHTCDTIHQHVSAYAIFSSLHL